MWSRHVRAASMARNLYFLGTAGSGKSTMVYAFQLWMNSQGLDCVTVNLDPGAESLQYSPDLDVRDYVNLSEIMEEQDLGPNGAQVAAADMIAMNARELAEVLETFETSYILIDTPGQIELFTFRASGPVLIDAFGREDSALVYLNDPALVKSASGFVSSVLLSATVQFRRDLQPGPTGLRGRRGPPEGLRSKIQRNPSKRAKSPGSCWRIASRTVAAVIRSTFASRMACTALLTVSSSSRIRLSLMK